MIQMIKKKRNRRESQWEVIRGFKISLLLLNYERNEKEHATLKKLKVVLYEKIMIKKDTKKNGSDWIGNKWQENRDPRREIKRSDVGRDNKETVKKKQVIKAK